MFKLHRKQRKNYDFTLSDDELDKESEFNQTNNVVVFTTRIKESSNLKLFDNSEDTSDNYPSDD